MKLKEKIKEIVNKILGKTKRGAAIGGLIGMATTATLTTGCGDKNKDFKQQYQYDVETPDLGTDNKQGKEQDTIIDRVDHLKTEQDVTDLLNDIYIDATGDDTLKAEDITISGPKNQNFVYVNKETGEMITHGSYPEQTEQKLKNDGVSYTTKDDVDVYRVEHKDGKVIDCMTLQSKDRKTEPVKVIIGDQYDEPYKSVLVKLGNIIPAGLKYKKFIETERMSDITVSKVELKKALEEFENEKVDQKVLENEIKALKTSEGVLQYLKNMYIEVYRKMTGDTSWTTADIELDACLKDLYKYEVKPNQENISSTAEHKVKVYQVKNTKKNVIDCVSLESKNGETVPVEVYMEGSIDNSVLATMGTVIPDGLNYVEDMEKGNENDMADRQRQFINSVKEFQNTKENQKIEEEKTQENSEKGFEPAE